MTIDLNGHLSKVNGLVGFTLRINWRDGLIISINLIIHGIRLKRGEKGKEKKVGASELFSFTFQLLQSAVGQY